MEKNRIKNPKINLNSSGSLIYNKGGISNLGEKDLQDFPGGSVVKNLPPNAESKDLIPGQGTKIPDASWPEKNLKKT